MSDRLQILVGDCREVLRTLPDASVQCCVTSPPYWGLRDYGVAGQIGLEESPEKFLAEMVAVFREVRRVLKDDGTCWVNLGDSYATGTTSERKPTATGKHGYWENPAINKRINGRDIGLKPKDLVGIPWRVAFALQADGWYLRQDIIWHKPNPMPESVTDRCTKAHEYVFLLSKSQRYFYDQEAIKESAVSDHDSGNGFGDRQGGASHLPMSGGAGTSEPWTRKSRDNFRRGAGKYAGPGTSTPHQNGQHRAGDESDFSLSSRNKRSVWTVPSMPYREAHFATYPPDLIKPCILAGTRPGDVVLDPFGGSGTTGQVALELGRRAVLIELNPDYAKLIERRTDVTPGLALGSGRREGEETLNLEPRTLNSEREGAA